MSTLKAKSLYQLPSASTVRHKSHEDQTALLCTCREQILSRAQELSETNAKLDVLPMIPKDHKFNMSFWSTVLQKTEEDEWEYEGEYIPDRLTVRVLLQLLLVGNNHISLILIAAVNEMLLLLLLLLAAFAGRHNQCMSHAFPVAIYANACGTQTATYANAHGTLTAVYADACGTQAAINAHARGTLTGSCLMCLKGPQTPLVLIALLHLTCCDHSFKCSGFSSG